MVMHKHVTQTVKKIVKEYGRKMRVGKRKRCSQFFLHILASTYTNYRSDDDDDDLLEPILTAAQWYTVVVSSRYSIKDAILTGVEHGLDVDINRQVYALFLLFSD